MKLGYNLGLRAGDRWLIQPLGRRISDVLLPFELLTHTCASTREMFAGTRLWGTYPANAVALGQTLGRYQDRWFGQFEEARENLFLHNRAMDNVAWSKIRIDDPLTPNTLTAPDGTATADLCVPTTANDTHYIRQSVAIDGSSQYCMSGFVRGSSLIDGIRLLMPAAQFPGTPRTEFGLTSGTVEFSGDCDGYGIIPCIDDWYFVWIVATSDAAASNYVNFEAYSSGSGTFAGDGVNGFGLWGAQFEIGAFPSSLIKTEASPVTRVKTQAYWDGALVPTAVRDGKHVIRVIPFFSSAAASVQHNIYRLYTTTPSTGFIALRLNNGRFDVVKNDGGLTTMVQSDPVTFSAYSEITLTMGPAAGTLRVQGASAGDGLYSGTAWDGFPGTIEQMYFGQNETAGVQWNGLLSEPYRS